MVRWLLETIEQGSGTAAHHEMLKEQLRNICGTSFCALAEGAMGPLAGLLEHFEQEIVDHIATGGCPFR
jgi:NADH-quinone oxidoreductase subunit F